jgi:hypothetical protein
MRLDKLSVYSKVADGSSPISAHFSQASIGIEMTVSEIGDRTLFKKDYSISPDSLTPLTDLAKKAFLVAGECAISVVK